MRLGGIAFAGRCRGAAFKPCRAQLNSKFNSLRALASKVATGKVTGVAVAAVVPAYLAMICVWQNATVSALLLVYFSNTGLARGTG